MADVLLEVLRWSLILAEGLRKALGRTSSEILGIALGLGPQLHRAAERGGQGFYTANLWFLDALEEALLKALLAPSRKLPWQFRLVYALGWMWKVFSLFFFLRIRRLLTGERTFFLPRRHSGLFSYLLLPVEKVLGILVAYFRKG